MQKSNLFIQRVFPYAFWIAVIEIIALTIISMMVMAAIYPDLLIHHRVRFTGGHEVQHLYESAFILANQFLNGGLQMWNRFDQVNYSWKHISLGFYTIPALMEGWIFAKIFPWLERPAEFFHRFHSVFYFSLLTLIQTIGGYALLSLFTENRSTRWMSLIIFNTLLAVSMYSGLAISFIYSLAPLLLYYTFKFFNQVTGKSFLLIGLVFTLIFANSPVLTLGYFYQGYHFVLVTCLIGLAIKKWAPGLTEYKFPNVVALIGNYIASPRVVNEYVISVPRPRLKLPKFPDRLFSIRVSTLFWAGLLTALLLPIMLANFALLRIALRTFFIGGSGLGDTSGRLDNIFNPFAYYSSGYDDQVTILRMFQNALNFEQNIWFSPLIFLGSVVISLSIIGLVYGSNRWRITLGVIVFFLLALHYPRIERFWVFPFDVPLGLPSHAINALTNPFAFLVNSVNLTTFFIPYVLLAFVAMGIDSLSKLLENDLGSTRKLLGGLVFLVLSIIAFSVLPAGPSHFAGGIFLGLSIFIGLTFWPSMRTIGLKYRWILMILVAFVTVGEFRNLSEYLEQVPYNGDRIQPRLFEGLNDVGEVIIDYQNPGFMSLPTYVRGDLVPSTPNTDRKWVANHAEYFASQNFPGQFFRTVFIARHFPAPGIYEQRPLIYKNFPIEDFRKHIQRNSRYIYHADVALDGNQHNLNNIIMANLDNRAAILEAAPPYKVDGINFSQLPIISPKSDPEKSTQNSFIFEISTAKVTDRGTFDEYAFQLPKEFPAYMATNLFSQDRHKLRLNANGRSFTPAQGFLVRPHTFDVNNVVTRHLVVALAKTDMEKISKINLIVTGDPLIRNVWQNENDNFGFDYLAPSEGWMVIRNPYEQGWTASVNGKSKPLLKANVTSTAIPVAKGLNKILLQYKPDHVSKLRSLLKLMIFFMFIGFGFAFWYAVRDSSQVAGHFEEHD